MPVTANTWLGATNGTGILPAAAQQQAFLGVHRAQWLYAGVQRAAQLTAGSGSTSSNGLYIAQSFTTAAGQTAVGYVTLSITSNTGAGANLAPLTIGLYANSGSAPTGAALVSVTAPAEYVFPTAVPTVFPLPVTGLSASTTYWIVASAAGNGTYSYAWAKSNQTSGTSTSTNGTSWTAQTYGSVFAVYDQTAVGQLTALWEDGGARWQALTYTTTGEPATLGEYTVAQSSSYVQGYRTLTYSNGLLTKVS